MEDKLKEMNERERERQLNESERARWKEFRREKEGLPEWEGEEGVSGPFVELGLELHPVQTESVQERGQALHQHWASVSKLI